MLDIIPPMKSLGRALHALVILLNRKVAGRPFGIWIAWAALIYTAGSYSIKLRMVSASAYFGWPLLSELIGIWPAIIAAAVTLGRRKLISVAFGGIALGFLFYHALFHSDLTGIVLAPAGFAGLLACRRWYIDRLPSLR